MYSFGVLLLEMATAAEGGLQEAFGGMGGMALVGRIAGGWRPDVPPSLAGDGELAVLGKQLMRECALGVPRGPAGGPAAPVDFEIFVVVHHHFTRAY